MHTHSSCLIVASLSLNLSAETMNSSFGTICPQVIFTCSALNLPSLALYWFFNDTPVALYHIAVVGEDRFVPPPPALAEVVTIEIVKTSLSVSDSANFISTLRTMVPMLRDAGVTNISCGSISNRSNVNHLNFAISKNNNECKNYFNMVVLAPTPSLFSPLCSLEPYHGNASLLWSPDPQNSADVYHIQVSPEPSSACPHEVRPGETYNCSGLRLGEEYTVIINASNCNSTQQRLTSFQVYTDGTYQRIP